MLEKLISDAVVPQLLWVIALAVSISAGLSRLVAAEGQVDRPVSRLRDWTLVSDVKATKQSAFSYR